MIYREEKRNLFSVDFNKWTPAHCISWDCKMGAGIAVPMKKRFKLNELKKAIDNSDIPINWPVCFYYHGVYNLITKDKYRNKPSYDTMKSALVSMFYHVESHGIKHIVMPKIGSGLDRLSWPKVREIIQEVFEKSDVEILVCIK